MLALRRLGIALFTLAAVVFLTASARAEDPGPPIDKLLPNDTEMVFTLKPKAIFDSQVAKKNGITNTVKGFLESSDEVQTVLKELNLNPMTDIEQVTWAISSGSDPDKGLIIIRGKFDVDKFKAKGEEAAKDYKDIVTIHKAPDGMGGQHTVYEVTRPGAGQALFVAFASKTTIVAGFAKDFVLDALDKETGKKKTQLKNKEVQELLGRLDPKLMVAVAMPAKTLAENKEIPAEVKDYLDKMTDIVIGVDMDKDVKVQLVVTAKKAADAMALNQTIAKGVNTATAFLAILVNDQPQLEPVLDIVKSIKPKIKDKTITIEAQVSGDLVEKLLKNLMP